MAVTISSIEFQRLEHSPLFLYPTINSRTDSTLIYNKVFGSSSKDNTSLLKESTSVAKYTKIFVSIKYLIVP